MAQDDDHRFLLFMSGQRVADDAGHGQRSKQHVDQRENDHDDARRLQGGHIRFVHGKYLPLSYFVYRRPCPGPERPLTCNTLASEHYVYKKPFFFVKKSVDACAKEGGTLRTRSVPCFLSKAAASKTRKAENPGFSKHESLMTCIARPSVSSMGYWATNMSVERRVCVVDARRRMSGASRTTEATWNDKKSSIIMLAGGDAHLVPQGQAASPPSPPSPQQPPKPQAPQAPKAPSPQACKPASPKSQEPQAPESPKSPSRRVLKRPSLWAPAPQAPSFPIFKSSGQQALAPKSTESAQVPNFDLPSPKLRNARNREACQNRTPSELRISSIPQSHVGPAKARPLPKPRRRQAPARGPAAVSPHVRPIRNETKPQAPCSWGLGRVNMEPKALAGGTAAPKALRAGGAATRRHWLAALPP